MFSELRERQKKGAGFSLLEVMIAVAIVAVLAAVAVPGYYNHMMRSRQTAVIGELMAIKGAQERYFAENGGYAGRINLLDKYQSEPVTYTNGYYRYWITADTSALLTTGTIRAAGDLNGDGNFTDIWELSIESFDDKPKPPAGSVSNEGFSWSSLANLF